MSNTALAPADTASAGAELGTPIQGVTLYSFTRVWHGRRLTFEQLVREVAHRGLGPGLEIVGFQSLRGFPHVDDDFARDFRRLLDQTGLVQTALGANADAGLRRDRRLTNDEMVDYMAAQIAAAKKLGFPIVRVQFSVTPDDIERLLPIAEAAGITLGMELHAPHTPHHPVMQALLERYEKLGSPNLGFIPDWGATMNQMPRTLLAKYRKQGIDPGMIDAIDAYWTAKHRGGPSSDEDQHAQFGEIVELAQQRGYDDLAIEFAVNATELFGHGNPQEWADIMAWAVHSHGKFYEIDAAGEDPSVPTTKIMDLYLKNGYSKTISSEWEGFHFNDYDDAFDIIAAQQALLRRTAEQLGSRIVTDAREAKQLRGW